MPAFLYDYCRKGEHGPIRVGKGFVIPTDRQTQDHLLCKECEHILNRGGEQWLARKLATWERTFPLYELLAKNSPDLDDGDLVIYLTAKNPAFRGDCLIHFALGIFWKASVHSWSGTEEEPRIALGPYSDAIRRWLRSEADFPRNLYLNVAVSRPARAQISFNEPYEGTQKGWHTYILNVPGVFFNLSIGKTVDYSLRATCIQNNPERPIMVSEELTGDIERNFATSFHQSRKTTAFLKAMDKIGPRRSRR